MRRYTEQEKADALAAYVEHGPHEASRLTGIPVGTIASWAHHSGTQTVCVERTSARVEAAKSKAAERRAIVAERLWEIAEKATSKELELIDNDKADLRSVVGARTRAIHDAQLLDGGATSRFDMGTREAVTDDANRTALRLVG